MNLSLKSVREEVREGNEAVSKIGKDETAR
jgi:hypothetical protein